MSDFLTTQRSEDPKSLADVSVAILAGGLGTRLRPVVSDRPKVMAEVQGRPFLTWWLDALSQAGCREVVLCTGHLADHVSDWFGSRYGDMALHYSVEESPLGTGGALRRALPSLTSETVLAINGDSFCDLDLLRFRGEQLRRRSRAMMALAQVDDTSRFGRVDVLADGRITNFVEKGGNAGPGWINAGLYFFSRELLSPVAENAVISMEKDIFPQWLNLGLWGFGAVGRFIDIGTPSSLLQAEHFFNPSAEVAA